MKTYLLTYEATRFASNPRAVEAFISNHKSVSAWSSPFNGCFFLRSTDELKQLARSMDLFFNNRQFIITEINGTGDKTNGRSVKQVWEFIKGKDQQ